MVGQGKNLLAFAPNFKELYPEVGPPFLGEMHGLESPVLAL